MGFWTVDKPRGDTLTPATLCMQMPPPHAMLRVSPGKPSGFWDSWIQPKVGPTYRLVSTLLQVKVGTIPSE